MGEVKQCWRIKALCNVGCHKCFEVGAGLLLTFYASTSVFKDAGSYLMPAEASRECSNKVMWMIFKRLKVIAL